MLITHYPTLHKAFDLMLLDNVASAQIIKSSRAYIVTVNLEPVGVFDRAEAELSKLAKDQLYELCCGAQDEPSYPKVSSETDEVLTVLFEMMCVGTT